MSTSGSEARKKVRIKIIDEHTKTQRRKLKKFFTTLSKLVALIAFIIAFSFITLTLLEQSTRTSKPKDKK